MEQRISIVTLGVADLKKSTAFFERLGWTRSVKALDSISFFQCGGIAFSLYPLAALAEDVGIPVERSGFSGVTISHNGRSKEDVDAIMAEAERAGAEIVKPAKDAFWGGYSGYFRDLDGHLWEVAWNPDMPLDEAGAVSLPD